MTRVFHTFSFLSKTFSDRNIIKNFIYLQVWDGNEDCEEVMWEECKLVDFQKKFKVPKIECVPDEEIPWTDCVDDTKTQMVSKMTCQPKSTVSCSPQTSQLCTRGKIWNVLDFRRGVASKWIKQSPQIFVLFFSKYLGICIKIQKVTWLPSQKSITGWKQPGMIKKLHNLLLFPKIFRQSGISIWISNNYHQNYQEKLIEIADDLAQDLLRKESRLATFYYGNQNNQNKKTFFWPKKHTLKFQ